VPSIPLVNLTDGFNGAVLLRERKGGVAACRNVTSHASMGPFSCENGKPEASVEPRKGTPASMGPFSCENGKAS